MNLLEKYIYSSCINGIAYQAAYSLENVQEIFLPLLKKWTEMQRKKGGRLLVMLAAPPAAGKSTLAALLEDLSGKTEGVTPLTVIGLDGFHHYRDWLSAHTIERNGEIVPMSRVKGAPETFDLIKLQERIRRLKTEEVCLWPYYDRNLHDPVEDKVEVRGDIVLLEGNYLLLDWPGWRELHREADHTVRILVDETDVRERLIWRKMATGMSREDAEKFADYSDLFNVRTCMQAFLPADVSLRLKVMDETAVFTEE